MLADIRAFLAQLPVAELDAVECSSDTYVDLGWRRHDVLRYPGFDLTDPPADVPTYDVVLCEQVLEHVTDPWAAARTLRQLCRPGGWVIVSTPFLLKIHEAPGDYWRFTPDGLRLLLEAQGARVRVVGDRTPTRRSAPSARCARGSPSRSVAGTIAQGDAWLQANLDGYAQWAKTHNSLLIVTWDEDDYSSGNKIATIFYGEKVKTGTYTETINHYTVLRTIEDMYGLSPVANAATATAITDCWVA